MKLEGQRSMKPAERSGLVVAATLGSVWSFGRSACLNVAAPGGLDRTIQTDRTVMQASFGVIHG